MDGDFKKPPVQDIVKEKKWFSGFKNYMSYNSSRDQNSINQASNQYSINISFYPCISKSGNKIFGITVDKDWERSRKYQNEIEDSYYNLDKFKSLIELLDINDQDALLEKEMEIFNKYADKFGPVIQLFFE